MNAAACTRCGAALPAEARFCPACGTPVEAVAAAEERKLVTVLFADVTGSTQLGEQLDPEHLREVMARYFAAMREEVEAEGGVVEKFIGDAVMAAFGVPAAHEDDPSRAVRAAIRMRSRLADVNEELAGTRRVTLEIRIGINTGEVLATVAPGPGEPMVTGDTVNVAARLQAEAAPGGVLVSERTARAARGFRFRDAGPRELKGKSTPVAVFELMEVEEALWERGVPGLRAPLVGRDAELDLLRSVFARSVAEGKPNLVTIYGDAGVGKSRLTAEFVAEAEDAGATVLRGRCLPYGDGITYWPLAEILKSFASILDSDPPELALEKIQKASKELLTREVIGDPVRGIAALGSTVGIDDPDVSLASLDPRRVQQEVHAAWRSFFSALAARSPLVGVVEDIHWADPALLDLLDECAERVAGPVLFLCPTRPDLAATRPGWGGGRRNRSSIALDPLTQEDADRLITELLAIDDLPISVHDRILAKAEGNPFFLEEIVRHLIDEGHIVRDGGRWRAEGTIARVVIPDTVQAVLSARIDLLDGESKRVLQAAGVVGRIFWPGPVALLAERSPDVVDDALRVLEDRELVVSRLTSSFGGEPELAFKHVLTRDVAYASLPLRERSRAHEAVAAWIEATAGDRRRDFVELLAFHYEEAYRSALEQADAEPDALEAIRGKALRKLLLAAEDAHRTFAVDKALKLGERALSIAAGPLERARALERIGLTAISDYRGDLAWSSLREAAELLVAAGADPRTIARVCARAAETPRRWPGSMNDIPAEQEVERLVTLGLASAPDGDSEERVRILMARAFGPWAAAYTRSLGQEELSDARSAGMEAADMALRLGRADLASAALDGASASTALGSDFTRSTGVLGFVETRLGLLPQVEDPWERGDIYAVATWTYAFVGDYDRAVEVAVEGVNDANAPDGTKTHTLAWRCFAEYCRGNWDAIVDELFPWIARVVGDRAAGFPYYLTHAFGTRMMIASIRGDADAERRLAEIEQSADIGPERTPATTGWTALAHARTGDGEWLERLLTSAENPPARPFFDRVIADSLALLGWWDRVPGFLRNSRAFAERGELEGLRIYLDRLEGRTALAAGDVPRAIEVLTTASRASAAAGAVWERASTDLSLGEALLAAGRPEDAGIAAERGLAVFERLRALREIERARALLDDLDAS